jgi:glycerol-3-phosphate dehydrogenase
MADIHTEVLVIGGGATGTGVVRDVAMRGFEAVLVDRYDLAEGTTGRFHGLLHSGGRYVVKDPGSASECYRENVVLRRIVADAIEDSGGFFVSTPWDDPDYGDKFLAGCADAGVAVAEIEPAEALTREPRLNREISRVFEVPDASIDAWKLVWGNARSAMEYGAKVLTRHRVVGIVRDGDRVRGARVANGTDEELTIWADYTINATGAWAEQIAEMAKVEGVEVLPGKGIMIAMNHRLVNTVVNRCTLPADGDILVPIRTVSVIGTTDIRSQDPDELDITDTEIAEMMDAGEKLVPGFREQRAMRVWAGVRPLFHDRKKGEAKETRHVSRSHALLDHRERDGVEGFLTITGGKVTTFRLMAEETVDRMCAHLNIARDCRTAEESLPESEDRKSYWLGERLEHRDSTLLDDQLICECEMISRHTLEAAIRRRRIFNLDDLRRSVRLGMGPCQGGFCIYRATGILHSLENLDRVQANSALVDFLQERWKGINPVLYGDQFRQAQLDDWIFKGLLDVENLPR